MNELAVIIPAAGSSTRFGRNKLAQLLGGQSVFFRSIRAMRGFQYTSRVFVASNDMEVPADVTRCKGGPTRANSVWNALKAIPARYEWVAIHDAARPLVSNALIDRVYRAAIEHGAAVPALPVSLTIKQAPTPLPARVQRTVPRHELWAMQTPQIMRRNDLLDAFEKCPIPLEAITDDAQLLELQGKEVWLVPGEETNIKITTPLDLKLAEVILSES